MACSPRPLSLTWGNPNSFSKYAVSAKSDSSDFYMFILNNIQNVPVSCKGLTVAEKST